MTWTSKERILAVLNKEVPDRVPIFDLLINDDVLKFFGGEYISTGNEENWIKACSRCLDLCHPMIEGMPFEPGEVLLPDGTRRVYERWTYWDIPFQSRTEENIIKNIKEQIDQYESYKPKIEEIELFKEKVKKINKLANDMVYIHLGLSAAFLPGTIEQGIYLYADHSELVERWVKARDKATLQWIDVIADPNDSPVAIIWNDIAFKNNLIYPPWLLEKLLFPSVYEFCQLLHSKGIKVIFHSDGNVNKALKFLIECGIDGFNPLEISAGMDYKLFKEEYGNKITLVGGLDAIEILSFATPEIVAIEVKKYLEIAGKKGGLIAASSSGQLDNSMPFENIMVYFETVWNWRY
ncbi:MAG: hypothetical protein N3D72_00605 [Candidatus Methanomethyliaceae archaeon]|nr:hypothetical protein [Candidatus Methanomethyliaceae archaeon]